MRHPGYAANYLVQGPYAVAIGRGWLPMLVVFVVFLMVYRYRVTCEEAMLKNSPPASPEFAAAYKKYMKETPSRLIPFIY